MKKQPTKEECDMCGGTGYVLCKDAGIMREPEELSGCRENCECSDTCPKCGDKKQSMKEERLNIEDYDKGFTIDERDDSIEIDLCYPRQNKIKHVMVGISDVRASDGIRITYDFERDGYVIEQPTQLAWKIDEPVDYKWKEVAFVQSWALEEEQKKNEE